MPGGVARVGRYGVTDGRPGVVGVPRCAASLWRRQLRRDSHKWRKVGVVRRSTEVELAELGGVSLEPVQKMLLPYRIGTGPGKRELVGTGARRWVVCQRREVSMDMGDAAGWELAEFEGATGGQVKQRMGADATVHFERAPGREVGVDGQQMHRRME
ncbi:unnamed protein product [Cylindrotheca closterium]|uniref:Uncharacterized protein n=1 Tax=Cylindrotheca closterium TaxID=2856 RepID=A0AAD2GDN4_9STRA|nr:unnamed protein product [Cylindrotheca closterium]